MDNLRLILLMALSLVVILLYEAWQEDFNTPQTPTVAPISTGIPIENQIAGSATVNPDSVGESNSQQITAEVPSVNTVPSQSNVPLTTAPTNLGLTALKTDQRITVETDVFTIEIDTIGGDLRQVLLNYYPVRVDEPENHFSLFSDKIPPLFVAQTGLLSSAEAPNHTAQFVAEKSHYAMAPGEETLTIPLTWKGKNLTVVKTFTFRKGDYAVDVDYTVTNHSDQAWQGRQYRQLQRSSLEVGGSVFIYTFTGGVIYSEEEKYEKISFDDMADDDLARTITGGWAAMIQHYFVAAWIPDQKETNFFYSKSAGEDRYVLGMISPDIKIGAGESTLLTNKIYVGPKDQDALEVLAPGLELTVDYGFLTVIAKPLFWLLTTIYDFIGNWGVSIAILTLIVKLLFYKLSATSYRSMANMRLLTPKVTKIRERFGDDRQRMSQAMMELYKKEKINPLGGCLPMLVQIPVFIALYWVLLESVELRQAPFMLWINDLSNKDPFYVLPLLMGATMFVQQKLHPPPPDPVQAKVMMALPFIFTLFFAFFPAGLVLYWVVNNSLSILQQWYILQKVEKETALAKAKAKA